MPKVADYPLRTSVSPTDVLYIIGDDDGQITLEQFFRNVNTPFVTTSTVAIGGVAQTRFNSGEINATTNITKLTTDADGVTLTIANGLYEGQLKVVLMDQFGGEAVLDGPNLLAPITFGETTAVVLMWVGTVWRNVTGGSGGAGAQGPIGYTGSQGPIGYTGSAGSGSGGSSFTAQSFVEWTEVPTAPGNFTTPFDLLTTDALIDIGVGFTEEVGGNPATAETAAYTLVFRGDATTTLLDESSQVKTDIFPIGQTRQIRLMGYAVRPFYLFYGADEWNQNTAFVNDSEIDWRGGITPLNMFSDSVDGDGNGVVFEIVLTITRMDATYFKTTGVVNRNYTGGGNQNLQTSIDIDEDSTTPPLPTATINLGAARKFFLFGVPTTQWALNVIGGNGPFGTGVTVLEYMSGFMHSQAVEFDVFVNVPTDDLFMEFYIDGEAVPVLWSIGDSRVQQIGVVPLTPENVRQVFPGATRMRIHFTIAQVYNGSPVLPFGNYEVYAEVTGYAVV